jgi:hypothetical protein
MNISDSSHDIPSVVFDSLSMGRDFSVGISFAKSICKRFFSAMHSSRDSDHFTLVVSFGRANFHLSEDSAGIALEAAIGGFCGSLKVSILRERVFSFVVSSKQVGFHILNLRSYACPQFKCYFHLWGQGGLNWMREFKFWQQECRQEWTLASPSKRRMQLGLSAMKKPRPKSAINSLHSVSKRLSFATTIDYVACKGYTCGNSDSSIRKENSLSKSPALDDVGTSGQTHWTISEPSIPFGTIGSFPIREQCSNKSDN